MARRFQPKKLLYLVVGVLILGGGIIFVPRLFTNNSIDSSSSISSNSIDTKPPRASIDLNKEFEFPVSSTDKTKKVKMILQKAQLLDEIVVKGQKATAVSGRTFLILDMKIVNDMDNALNMNTRDYIRLSLNKNDAELLAPDIHNDPVEIQAISTKYTRLGFPVNVTDRNFVLQVGEIKATKQKIELPFNN